MADKPLKIIMGRLGVTAEQVATKLGYSMSTVWSMMSLPEEITQSFVNKFCSAYRVNPAYFDGSVELEEALKDADIAAKPDNMEIGQRIHDLRVKQGLSMRDLASMAGCSHGVISRAERGVNAMSDSSLKAIADAFGVSVDWLRTGEGRVHDKVTPEMIDYINRNHVLRRVIWGMMEEE